MKVFQLLFLLVLSQISVAQTSFDEIWGCSNYFSKDDTSKTKYCNGESPAEVIIYVTKHKFFVKRYDNTHMHGLIINFVRQGWWNIYDVENNLIEQDFYLNGIIVRKLYYSNGDIVAMETFQLIECPKDKLEPTVQCFQKLEFIVFNKKRRIKEHYYFLTDGSLRIEYPGKKKKPKILQLKEEPRVYYRF